jgi:hypothetical protein
MIWSPADRIEAFFGSTMVEELLQLAENMIHSKKKPKLSPGLSSAAKKADAHDSALFWFFTSCTQNICLCNICFE